MGDKIAGQLVPGNIDLNARPIVRNSDGSISTVRSMSTNIDGKEVLFPTVSDDGRIMSDQEAVDTFLRTGKHLGMFDTPENASAYAIQLHNDQARQYVPLSQVGQSNSLDTLAGSKGTPLSDIGRNSYVAPPQADINGPIDPNAVKQYLARTGMIYPPLFQVNQAAWEAALANMPESLNIEDRRGINRKR